MLPAVVKQLQAGTFIPLCALDAHPHYFPVCVQMGFFADAGPLQVFVSNHLIPEDFEFESSHEPCYVTSDGEQKILPGAEVRLRIVGTRIDATEIVRNSGVPVLIIETPVHAAPFFMFMEGLLWDCK